MTFLPPNRIEELRQTRGFMSDPESRDLSAALEELQYLRRIAPVSVSPGLIGLRCTPFQRAIGDVIAYGWTSTSGGTQP